MHRQHGHNRVQVVPQAELLVLQVVVQLAQVQEQLERHALAAGVTVLGRVVNSQ